jgi:hypothetical protein
MGSFLLVAIAALQVNAVPRRIRMLQKLGLIHTPLAPSPSSSNEF